jgi:hypothetical protein
MADVKVQVTRNGPEIIVTARISGPDWALGLDPDEARAIYAKVLAQELSASWMRAVADMTREVLDGTGTREPKGLFP